MITKLTDFINENHHVLEIDNAKQLVKFVESFCPEYNPSGPGLYRSVQGYSHSKSHLFDPSIGKRELANDSAAYTAMLEILPSWRSVPKRANSVVFATEEDHAKKFGDGQPFNVIPISGAKCAYFRSHDVWDVNQFVHRIGLTDIGEILLCVALNMRKPAFGEKWPQVSYTKIQDYINNTTVQKFKADYGNKVNDLQYSKLTRYFNSIVSARDISAEPLITLLDSMYDASETLNGEKLVDIMEYPNIRRTNGMGHEGWTESKCLLVPEKMWMEAFG